jgi:hypothetical protein
MSIDDIIALLGLLLFLIGIYLWIGLAATLIAAGIVLVYIGMRVEIPHKVNK